jgi:hypothetical protein
MVFIQEVHHRPKRVWAKSFADQTLRVVEAVVQLDDGKAVCIQGMGFSLIRFDGAGQPDMKRYWKEVNASLLDILDPNPPGFFVQNGYVIHMEHAFVGNGGKWVPTLAERMLLEQVALGQIRPKELDRGWRKPPTS